MVFKKWMMAIVTAVALVACGNPAVQAVARVDNVSLSRQDLDQRIDRVLAGYQKQAAGGQVPPRTTVEKQLVDLFVTQNLMLGLAKQKGVSVSDKEVDDRINEFRQQIASSGTATFDEIVQDRLGLPGGDSSEFRQFASFSVAQEKLAATLVTSDTIRSQIEQQVQQQASQKVKEYHSAHILFAAGDPQSGAQPTDADFAAALEKANKALDRLKQGEDFGTLAKELSDDPGSKDKGGEYDWIKQGSFVPEYEKAVLEDLKPGEYTITPVKSQYGYHIIKLLEPVREVAAMSPEEAQQMIEQQIGQQLQDQRGAALQKLLTDERAKAKTDGRLVEPDYPDPTAEPAPVVPEQPTGGANAQPPAEQPTEAAPTPGG